MAKRPAEKMSVADRAKQFAPFAALGGLEEALREKELEHEEKIMGKRAAGDGLPEPQEPDSGE